jgi:hypothetical protein
VSRVHPDHSGWRATTDSAGETYYYSMRTRQRSWADPRSLSASVKDRHYESLDPGAYMSAPHLDGQSAQPSAMEIEGGERRRVDL